MNVTLSEKEERYLDINSRDFPFPVCVDYCFIDWLKDSNRNERFLDTKFVNEDSTLYLLTYSNLPI